MLYDVEATPPWYLCFLLGFQNCLLVIGFSITVPLLLSEVLCMDQDKVAVSELIGTTFFVTGLSTLLQTTLGIRLPVIQGCSASFLTQAVTLMKAKTSSCKTSGEMMINATIDELTESNRDAYREEWVERMTEVQGAIIAASLFEIIVGFSGTMGFLLRFVGPLTITPALTLIGFSLVTTASEMASKQWWIALTAIFLFILCSQYLRDVGVTCPCLARTSSVRKLPVFSLFPILIAILGTWGICAILTASSVLPDKPSEWGYAARTDTGFSAALKNAVWARIPYPGQWGVPRFTTSGVLCMIIAVFVTMIEAVGNFYACATIADAPTPPANVLNRGILVQGISCMLAGVFGTGNGTATASDSLSIIGVTKVASLRVVQTGGIIWVVLGCIGKFNALFVTIPSPIIGGVLMTVFGIITAVGLYFLQFVDLNSFRNIFILGFSLFFGIGLSSWVLEHDDVIKTGSGFVDQTLTVLLSTSMFVGAVTGFILDNTIRGTHAERGIRSWRELSPESLLPDNESSDIRAKRRCIYDLPLVTTFMKNVKLFKYLPFCFVSLWTEKEVANGPSSLERTVSKETVSSTVECVKL